MMKNVVVIILNKLDKYYGMVYAINKLKGGTCEYYDIILDRVVQAKNNRQRQIYVQYTQNPWLVFFTPHFLMMMIGNKCIDY